MLWGRNKMMKHMSCTTRILILMKDKIIKNTFGPNIFLLTKELQGTQFFFKGNLS